MKMKKEHYEAISEAMAGCLRDIEKIKLRYEYGQLSMKRMRWDIMYHTVSSQWVCKNLYPYLNDDHIDTALRKLTNTK